ncbi:MAG: restriction endonuclease subunit S [Verminephrobacter sp.]|nr:restriction endonuclease subunit S [Verminephrobacter sp.]
MSFPRYPEYKDSGLEWLGEVPAHWETWKVAHAFGSIGSGTTPPSSEEHWYDEVGMPWVTTGELRENIIVETNKSVTTAALEKFSALRIHPAGSLVVAMYGATIGRLGILGVDAVTNQACCVLSAPRSLSIAFTYYWLQGFKQIIIDLFSTGGGQPNINQDTVANLRIPAPGLGDQTAIATFLDRETAKIDALVAEQEKLIALRQEKRQAVISHAVTKGLDPNVPMKDSGVEWLGEVPEHWGVKRLKHNLRLLTDKTDRRTNPIALENIESWSGRLIPTETEFQGDGVAFEHGDILFGKLRPYLAKALLATYPGEAVGDFHVMRPSAETYPRFAQYGLLNTNFIDIVDGSTFGSKMPRASWDFFGAVHMPTPPLAEQTAIAAFVESETAKLDTLMTEARNAITLLQERRTALISAAVTGQIDVRALAGGANAPDSVAASAYSVSA